MQASHTHMSFTITSLIDFLSASNMAGFSRDEACAPREENAVQIPSKKAHLDTTTSALDVVAAGMRGVHHHLHDRVLVLNLPRALFCSR
jgi:hypothetical protein